MSLYITIHPRIYFQNDLENGNGTFVWADGYRYTGAFIDGLKTGYGEYYYKNGDNYKGMFQVGGDDDDMVMMMVMTFFQAGKFHGQGEYSWSNGAKYVGEHDQVSCDWRRSGHVTPCSPLIGAGPADRVRHDDLP